jgi:glycosyltransferase involved in cell wall biosynthesis
LIVPEPVTTPSPGIFCSSIPKSVQLCSTYMSSSSKLPSSSRMSSRSRAVSLPLACCASIRFSPTGGSSLYEAKKHRHDSVHLFPSSVDRNHFGKARNTLSQPDDQADINRPRLGFYGVLDERFDTELLSEIAEMRPDWSFIMVGPVVKISEDDLPKGPNIHYLGSKKYEQLPAYLSGWDVALMPFAMNESTQFISPTKTPEYLAGGKPVVSTPIKDVVRHYGQLEGVGIAASPDEFVAECERMLKLDRIGEWLGEADLLLSATSWITTQGRMAALIAELLGERTGDSSALLVAAQ